MINKMIQEAMTAAMHRMVGTALTDRGKGEHRPPPETVWYVLAKEMAPGEFLIVRGLAGDDLFFPVPDVLMLHPDDEATVQGAVMASGRVARNWEKWAPGMPGAKLWDAAKRKQPRET